MNASEPKKTNARANRLLYIAVAAVLCAATALTGVWLARRGEKEPIDRAVQADETPTTAPIRPVDSLPVFGAPLSGTVTKGHDLSVPVYSTTMQEYRVHSGIDVAAPVGTAVCAMADGTVTDVCSHPLLGTCVTVSHTGDASTVYCNLAEDLAEGLAVGASVRAGQALGCVGETALCECADEPHLHLEMTVAGVSVDPLDYISEGARAASFSPDDGQYEY